MKKVVFVLCLGLVPAWVRSNDLPIVIQETLRFDSRRLGQELLTKSIGNHSFTIAGISVLSTKEAGSILGDFAMSSCLDEVCTYDQRKLSADELAALYLREKAISTSHWLLEKTGLSLPQWVKNSPGLLRVLDTAEHCIASQLLASIHSKLKKTTSTK